jgi:hypothetical protein
VATANIGVYDAEQLRRNVRWVKDFRPLSPDEEVKLVELGRKMASQWGEHLGPVTETNPPRVRTA